MSGRILLVDDDDASLLTFGALLEDAGFVVTTGASCEEARELLSGTAFDVVVTDQHLDDGEGIELAPDVRRTQPGAAFAILTGSAPTSAAGIDACLTKGDAPDALVAKIRALADHVRRAEDAG